MSSSRIALLSHRTRVALGLLALLAALSLTRGADAQAAAQVLFGAAANATVDGATMEENAALEAIDGGAVVATAEWDGGFWFLTIPGDSASVQLRIGAALSDPITVQPGEVTELTALALVDASLVEQTTLELLVGWNLVSWLGPPTAPADAVASISGVVALFVWDVQAGFLRFDPAVPAFLNTLATLQPGQGVWVLMDAATSWQQALLPGLQDARTVPLLTGFNLVVWTGPDASPVGDTFGDDPALLTNVIGYDPVAQRFDGYTPGGLAILNRLAVLDFGRAFWLQVTQDVVFDLPAFTP